MKHGKELWLLLLLILGLMLASCSAAGTADTADEAETALSETATSLTWVSFGGKEMQLTVLPVERFRGLGAEQTVRTSNGDTTLSDGIAIAGSVLRAESLSGSAQWQQPAICLEYSTRSGREALITELGSEMRLRVDGADYQPQVIWYTDNMLYFIFDCTQLPEGEPLLALEGQRLIALADSAG